MGALGLVPTKQLLQDWSRTAVVSPPSLILTPTAETSSACEKGAEEVHGVRQSPGFP